LSLESASTCWKPFTEEILVEKMKWSGVRMNQSAAVNGPAADRNGAASRNGINVSHAHRCPLVARTMTDRLFAPATPPQSLIDTLQRRCRDALTIPAAAQEALNVARDPKCRTEHLICVVQRDARLSAELLVLANNAALGAGRKSVNLKEAFVRVGLNQVRNLIVASCATASMLQIPLEQEWIRGILIKHGYATATASVYLNRALRLGCRGEEFTCGLLHDVGRMLLAAVDPTGFARVDPLSFQEDEQQLERERDELGTDHCAVGAWFANHLRLPEPLSDVIGLHHRPGTNHPHRKLIAVTAAADHIANHMQRFSESVGYQPSRNRAIETLEQCIGKPLGEAFAEVAHRIIDESLIDVASCGSIGAVHSGSVR
jgi:HD-like signal output (HDOD) protein